MSILNVLKIDIALVMVLQYWHYQVRDIDLLSYGRMHLHIQYLLRQIREERYLFIYLSFDEREEKGCEIWMKTEEKINKVELKYFKKKIDHLKVKIKLDRGMRQKRSGAERGHLLKKNFGGIFSRNFSLSLSLHGRSSHLISSHLSALFCL